jgi:hypothetical protein
MLNAQQLADRYAAVWNETDAAARRDQIATLWTPDGDHVVRTMEARGHAALEQRIIGSHEKNVRDRGFRFRACPNAQGLHGVVTFNWEMFLPTSGEVAATGLEFLHVDTDGMITHDFQFIVS